MRPINRKWKSTPGNFDPNHTMDPMPSDNHLGIPSIEGTVQPRHFNWTRNYDDLRTIVRKQRVVPEGLGLIHFFTEDYRFEQLWTSPPKFVDYMPREHWTLTPDFSVYTDHPPAVHLWNIFRSRWLGAYWQRAGLKVIPTVGWATPESYEYCFLGLPTAAILAVSTAGCLKNPVATEYWKQGFEEMRQRLNPSSVVCYGDLPKGFESAVPCQILKPFYARFPAKKKPTTV